MRERTNELKHNLLSLGVDFPNSKMTEKSKTMKTLAPFDRIARDCHSKLVKLETFLNETLRRYVDFQLNSFSDVERNKVDALVSEALGEAESSIKTLDRLSLEEEKANCRDHQRGIVMLLLDFARSLQQMMNGARSLRQRHVLLGRDKLCSVVSSDLDAMPGAIVDEKAVEEIEQLDDEEVKMLEMENSKLVEHLGTVLEEARQIEKNAVQVSNLLAMFSDEVMKQHQTIGTIYDEAQNSVDTISKVPKELIRAAEHNKASRYFMLTFLVVSALLLLLFDWMN